MWKYRISIFLNLCLFTVLFATPVDVELPQCIGVGGFGCPSSCNISLMILAYFALKNSAPSSTSADDAAINLSIWHNVNISPFRWTGCLSCALHPRKKFPDAQLHADIADKYDASEWKFRIISDA